MKKKKATGRRTRKKNTNLYTYPNIATISYHMNGSVHVERESCSDEPLFFLEFGETDDEGTEREKKFYMFNTYQLKRLAAGIELLTDKLNLKINSL